MLMIRAAQMEAFQDHLLNEFAIELADRMKIRHSSFVSDLDPSELVSLVREEVDIARGFGVQSRGQLRRYTDLSATLDWGFGNQLPWANAILADTEQRPEERLARIEQAAVFESRKRG